MEERERPAALTPPAANGRCYDRVQVRATEAGPRALLLSVNVPVALVPAATVVPENEIVNVPGKPVTVNAVDVQFTAAGCVSEEPTEPVTPDSVPVTAPDSVMLPVSDVPLCVSVYDTLAPKP